MKKWLLSTFLFGLVLHCTSQNIHLGYRYHVGAWVYIKTPEELILRDTLEDSLTISHTAFANFVFSPFRKIGKPLPTHNHDYVANATFDTIIFTEPKLHWEQSRIPVQRVYLEKKRVLIENETFDTRWVIVGRGKSARRLVWYLAPGPKQP